VRILFVCTGNICRSPAADAVFRALLDQAGLGARVAVDSAGTGDWHVGDPPDSRMCAAARRRGVDMDGLRARQLRRDDFTSFDLILAMDVGHLRALERARPDDATARLALFLEYAPETGLRDVPDPYYDAEDAFERVLDLVEAGARGLLGEVRAAREP